VPITVKQTGLPLLVSDTTPCPSTQAAIISETIGSIDSTVYTMSVNPGQKYLGENTMTSGTDITLTDSDDS